MRARAALFAALLCALGPPEAAACWSKNAVTPGGIAAYRFHVLLEEGKYDELERETKRSLDLRTRLPDGSALREAWRAGLDADGTHCRQLRASMDPEAMTRLEPYHAQLKGWLAHNPDSAPARLANALYPLQVVYGLRGNGLALTVRPEAWPQIRTHLADARDALDALGASGRADPAWYEAKLEIARLEGADVTDYATILDEALERFPGYEPLYFAASPFYAPNWGGSEDAFADFVEMAVARTRDSMGEEMYARLYWTRQRIGAVERSRVDWKRMKAGFEHFVQRYPDPWNLNQFARAACIAGDAATTHALFVRIGKPLVAAWPSPAALEMCEKIGNVAAPRVAGATVPGF
jgi:hypothetical protein